MTAYLWITTLSIFAISIVTRCIPLALGPWMKRHPWIRAFGIVLLPAILVLLIAHGLKEDPLLIYPYGIPGFAGIGATVGLHLWFRNMLLSIMGGFAAYQSLLYVM